MQILKYDWSPLKLFTSMQCTLSHCHIEEIGKLLAFAILVCNLLTASGYFQKVQGGCSKHISAIINYPQMRGVLNNREAWHLPCLFYFILF